MLRFKGVLFDMDGVIINSEPIHNLKWSEVLRDLGIHAGVVWFERFAGVPDSVIAEEIIRTFGPVKSSKELIQQKNLKYSRYIQLEIKQIPELTDAMKSLGQYKLGLVTASNKAEANMITHKMGIEYLFDTIVGGDEVTNNKPDPDIYLKAAGALNIDPALCIAVEDSYFGVQSAKNAGLFVIGIANSLSHSGLTETDHICKNTFEAISYIKTLH
ncbi:MAG: HAD family phosphatase [Ferruginibacter sp.]